jgi:fructose-1,6-bisphosphatase/inositol monophosphatase family enzyme
MGKSKTKNRIIITRRHFFYHQISVALAIYKKFVLRVIGNPVPDYLYSAIHDKGAFKKWSS